MAKSRGLKGLLDQARNESKDSIVFTTKLIPHHHLFRPTTYTAEVYLSTPDNEASVLYDRETTLNAGNSAHDYLSGWIQIKKLEARNRVQNERYSATKPFKFVDGTA